MKITIYDIAKLSGTSPRTVTRAFQEDSPIRQDTREKILRIAGEYGYKPNKIASRIQGKNIRIGAVFRNNVPDFTNEIVRGFEDARNELADLKTQVDIYLLTNKTEAENALHEMLSNHIDGVVCSFDDCFDRETLAIFRERGIPVVSIVNGLPGEGCLSHVGNDVEMGGRMACELLSMLVPGGKVSLFTGDMQTSVHSQMVKCFREEALRRNLQINGVYNTLDDVTVAQNIITELLEKGFDSDGIFFASANSTPVIEELLKNNIHAKIIASDIFPKMSEYIRNGTVLASLYQKPYQQGKTAVMNLYYHLAEHRQIPEKVLITPIIILQSNLHLYERENNPG